MKIIIKLYVENIIINLKYYIIIFFLKVLKNNCLIIRMSNELPKKRGRKPKKTNNLEMKIDTIELKKSDNKVVEPKKRGRKPKPKTETDVPKVYKKRGRKPKPKPDNFVEKIPKKRGRKPKENVSVNNVVFNNINEEQVILHLPIKTNKLSNTEIIENKLLRYNPSILVPEPFEPELFALPLDDNQTNELTNTLNENVNNFNENVNNFNEDILLKTSNEFNKDLDSHIIENNSLSKDQNLLEKLTDLRNNEIDDIAVKKETPKNSFILLEYKNSNIKKTWPRKVKISCFWCTSDFNNQPYGIPIKKIEDTYHMFGNFCSKECAAAYIFDSQNINKWESYSLLNMLYSNPKNPIKIAPDRICLRKFGGNLSIEEFRNTCDNKSKDYKVILPPMLSIIPTMEEVSINNDIEPKFVPLDTDRIKKADEYLRLKRNKPLPDFKNTLENCMNLRYL